MVLPIDYYAGSALKYIVINVIRRATVEGFEMANVEPPVQTKGTLRFTTLCSVDEGLRAWLSR